MTHKKIVPRTTYMLAYVHLGEVKIYPYYATPGEPRPMSARDIATRLNIPDPIDECAYLDLYEYKPTEIKELPSAKKDLAS